MPTPPMTLLVARRVEPAHYTAFIEWMHEGERLAADFPGYLGSGMLAPPPGAKTCRAEAWRDDRLWVLTSPRALPMKSP